MTIIEVINEIPLVHECSEPYKSCGICKYDKYCLLQPIKRAEEIPSFFDVLNKYKIKFFMLPKGARK